MINFNQIANPPQPTYRPMCVACEGRGVVPSLSMKSVQRCEQCNGTGKEGNTPEPADIPPIVDQLDTIFHGGLDAWKAEIQAVKTQFPKEVA